MHPKIVSIAQIDEEERGKKFIPHLAIERFNEAVLRELACCDGMALDIMIEALRVCRRPST